MVDDPQVRRELERAWLQAVGLLPPGSNPRREEQPHVTLRFIGETGVRNVRELERELREDMGRSPKPALQLGPLQTFPGILWAGVEGTEEDLERLRRLRRQAALAAARAGERGMKVQPEQHPVWTPHITLGRFDPDRTDRLEASLRADPITPGAGFRLETVALMESARRDPGVPQYRPLVPPM